MFAFSSSLIGQCWQKMKIMKAEFEESGSGLSPNPVEQSKSGSSAIKALREWMTSDVPTFLNSPIRTRQKHVIAFATK